VKKSQLIQQGCKLFPSIGFILITYPNTSFFNQLLKIGYGTKSPPNFFIAKSFKALNSA
jgi:hypothetical protein